MEIFRPNSLKKLDDEIECLVDQLSNMTNKQDENYEAVAKNLQRLMEARERKNDRVISSDTLVAAAINIIGMLIVLNFEKTGVITSRAFSLIGKKSLK